MGDNDTSLRDDLAAAMDSAEKAAETPAPAEVAAPPTQIGETPPPPQEVKIASDGSVRDQKGRFAPKIGEKKPEEAKAEPPKEGVPDLATGQAPPPVEPTPTPEPEKPKVRAPASWKPTAREGWEKVPPEIQQEVIRRERETAMALQETAQARQVYEKFKETVSPYEHMFKAEGVEPLQGIGNLIRTTAALATGPQQTKAQIVANIIKTYGVDLQTLDSLLAGQPAPTQAAPQVPYDPRVDQLLAQLSTAKAQKEAALQAQAAQAIAEVEQEEFFEDVREEMADLLEVASRRGLPLTPKDAYNRAILLHPEVSRVIEQRKAAANQGSTQRTMAAASSVRPQPTVAVSTPSDRDLRGELEAAWDKLAGKGR